jgi:hypothetical protein
LRKRSLSSSPLLQGFGVLNQWDIIKAGSFPRSAATAWRFGYRGVDFRRQAIIDFGVPDPELSDFLH